jgi:hypothetical protein
MNRKREYQLIDDKMNQEFLFFLLVSKLLKHYEEKDYEEKDHFSSNVMNKYILFFTDVLFS